MADDQNTGPNSAASGTLAGCLYLLAGVSTVAGIVMALGLILQSPENSPGEFHVWGGAMGVLFGGLVLGCLLLTCGWVVRRWQESLRVQRRILRLLSESSSRSTASPASESDTTEAAPRATLDDEMLQQILRQLAELNTNSLLSQAQREAKRQCVQSELAGRLARQIALAIDEGAFDQAEEMLARLVREIPDSPDIDRIRRVIQDGRQGRIHDIVQGQVRRATDLMSVSRFDEAMTLAEDLFKEHPQSPEADDLLGRVRREAETFHAEQRRRLFAVIQEHGEARQWSSALSAAHRLLENYSQSEEAGNVRAMMPTLVDNARIEEVRDYRDRIVDLMDRRRYSEAMGLARQVVENYPETTAAEELRQQMPRLSELARQAAQDQGMKDATT